jgi:hypothetical protein
MYTVAHADLADVGAVGRLEYELLGGQGTPARVLALHPDAPVAWRDRLGDRGWVEYLADVVPWPRRHSSKPRARSVSTITKSASTPPGTGTSPWPSPRWRSSPSSRPPSMPTTGSGAVVVTALVVLVALTVADLRRLLASLVWRRPVDPAFTLAWSIWRCRHQPPLDAPTTSNNAGNYDCRTNTGGGIHKSADALRLSRQATCLRQTCLASDSPA